jgi:protein-histidine pros-kinase
VAASASRRHRGEAAVAGDLLVNKSLSVAVIRLILGLIFVVVLIVAAGGGYLLLRSYAVARATDDARLVLNTALAIRAYTEQQVGPELSKAAANEFFDTSVPALASQSVFARVQKLNPAYSYREPALNPTNPNDRPSAIEIDLINRFRADPKLEELTGVREGNAGLVFYLARPIKATESCLLCHSTPERAPPAMVAKYGATNGFGWQLNEIIGLQALTVPIAEQLKGSVELAVSLAAGLLLAFGATYLAIRYALQVMLVRPLRELSLAARDASLSTAARVPVPTSGTSEIQDLAQSIRRLHESLLKALRQLSSRPSPPQS